MKKKDKKDIFCPKKPKSRWLVAAVVLVCVASDFVTSLQYSSVLFNEYPWVSWLVSGVTALGLDVSLAYTAIMVNGVRPRSATARRRRALGVGGMVGVFLLSYACLVWMAWSVEAQAGADMLRDGTLPRLLLPIATSILSFVMGWTLDPIKARLEEIDNLCVELEKEISVCRADCGRMQSVLAQFHPDQYDETMFRLSAMRIKAAMSQAQYQIRLLLAEELGSVEATEAVLNRDGLFLDLTVDELETTDLGVAPKGDTQAVGKYFDKAVLKKCV